MPNRARLMLLLALGAGLFYGRLVVPAALLQDQLDDLIALRDENAALRDELVDLQARNESLAEKVAAERIAHKETAERLIRAQIAAGPPMRRPGTLDEYEKLLREARPFLSGSNPAPEVVEGLVKALDPDSGLITVNLGSDSGLNKGCTLEVYRMKPAPVYVGVIQIVAVRPNEAVGKAVDHRTKVQVGDHVVNELR